MEMQMLKILRHLNEEQRERFIWLLKKSETINGIQNIKEYDLPKGSNNEAIVDQVVATYGKDAAVAVIIKRLGDIPRNDLVAMLSPQESKSPLPRSVLQQHDALPSSSQSSPPSGPEFLKRHRRPLAERISLLAPILNDLEDLGTLIKRERQEIQAKATPIGQNEALIEMVLNKGETAHQKFYDALKRADPHLVADLEKNG